jgi:RNA-binding protein
MLMPLTNPQLRRLKAAAQLLEPMFKVGKAGLSDGFVNSINVALDQHELVKIKFVEFKEQKRELGEQLASRTASHLVMRVGHVVVLHRPRGEEIPKDPNTQTPKNQCWPARFGCLGPWVFGYFLHPRIPANSISQRFGLGYFWVLGSWVLGYWGYFPSFPLCV